MELSPQLKILLGDLREELGQPVASDGFETYLTGLVIEGYTLGESLGWGAAGVVYQVSKDGQEYAIKVLAKGPDDEPERAALFQREVKIGQQIAHPSLVATYDTFEFGPAQFVVMEKVMGQTWKQALSEAMPRPDLLGLFEQLARGLGVAHEAGVVHRDLKPENVMLDQSGVVKILDFGMARLVGDVSVTLTGTFKGTVKYTSPEQLQDAKRAEFASDQYAFGVMMFEALTGAYPFQVDLKRPMTAIMAKLGQEPRTLMEVDPSFSAESSAMMAKMLARAPDQRFPSVMEAFQALKETLVH